jgi:hypothetical protein
MQKLASLGLCLILSVVLIFGSVNSSSFTPQNNAFAADMPGGSMDGGDSGSGGDSNQGGDSGGGEDDNDDDGSDGMADSKEAPQTTGALTAGGDSDNGGDNDNDSGGNQDSDNDNDDDEPTSKDAPQTADTITANKPDCPAGQEYYLFSASCKPVGGAENPGNTGVTAPTPTTCHVSYNPEKSDQSSVWGMKNKQLMKINRGVLYYTVDDKGIQQQQLSLFHQAQGMQLGKTYDLSSYSGTDCNINQVRNNDGSITATITYPNSPVKVVIRTDTTGKVPIQINYLDHNDKRHASEAIDNEGVATAVTHDVGYLGEPGTLHGIETREPGGTRPIISVVLDSEDGSVKILGRGALGQSSVGRHELQDDNDGDPTVTTTENGMKVTVTPFNEAYPNPEASKDDPLTTIGSNHLVFRITNEDSSVKTHMIIAPDGSVQPGSKWTTEAPVEPENE